MANGKSVKRQRQKEMRRVKIQEEIKQRQAARRKQRILLLVVLALIGAGVAYAMSDRGSDDTPDRGRNAAQCNDTKPFTDKTQARTTPPPMCLEEDVTYTAVFDTSLGSLEVELAGDTSPNTVNSFVYLARKGFYDGLAFHRIVKDFAIQGGDPIGDGTGGPGYKTVDAPPDDYTYEKGAVAMAKGGNEAAGTAGSQFFFVPAEGAALEPVYAVLGKVVKGEDVLEKLNNVPTQAGPSGEQSSPVEPVNIEKVTIRESEGS